MVRSNFKKTKNYGFKETLLSFQLWCSAVFYHLFSIYVAYISLPKSSTLTTIQPSTAFEPIRQSIQNVVQTTKDIIIPKEGKSLNPYIMALFIQILIFNVFFLLIYYLVNKLNRRYLNPIAIYLVGIITSIVFTLISRFI
jgi:ABC-type Fe3+-siderophore transport system permease subunit